MVEEMLAHGVPHRVLADHRRGAGLRLRDPRRRAANRWRTARAPCRSSTSRCPRAVKAHARASSRRETLEPGDVLITNDPWLCAGHLFDIAIVTPVFRNGRVVASSARSATSPTSAAPRTACTRGRSTRKGFQIPPMKLFRAGVPNEDLFALLARERAQARAGAGRHPRAGLGQRGGRAAPAAVHGRVRHRGSRGAGRPSIQDRAEARDARGDPRASPTASTRARSGTTAWARRCAIRVRSRWRATRSRSTSPGRRRSARAAAPTARSTTPRPTATYPLKCMLSPDVRGNAGCYRPFTVTAPEGSIAQLHQARRGQHCARAPAGTSRRTCSGRWRRRCRGRCRPTPGCRHRSSSTAGPRRAGLQRPPVPGRRPGRVGARRWQVRADVADQRRQHLDRAVRDARRRCWCWRRPTSPTAAGRGGTAAGSARSCASASSPTTGGRSCRPASRWRADADGRALRRPARRSRAGRAARRAGRVTGLRHRRAWSRWRAPTRSSRCSSRAAPATAIRATGRSRTSARPRRRLRHRRAVAEDYGRTGHPGRSRRLARRLTRQGDVPVRRTSRSGGLLAGVLRQYGVRPGLMAVRGRLVDGSRSRRRWDAR